MRRTTPALWLITIVLASALPSHAQASDECSTDPVTGSIICTPSGERIDPGSGPGDEPPPPWGDDPGRRYVYTTSDPVLGICYYWSDVIGGLDAWDPGNDPAVIAITTSLPECPVGVVDPEVRAWSVFRSWDLDPPAPLITPPDHGVTGLASHIDASVPGALNHSEVLPDGRTLQVRASVKDLAVVWGDGSTTNHDPDEARGFPDGTVTHTYTLKTCPVAYREEHPSGGLCHPTLEAYTIDTSWVWVGEFNAGAGWIPLGSLTRSTQSTYEVDEVRGINVP